MKNKNTIKYQIFFFIKILIFTIPITNVFSHSNTSEEIAARFGEDIHVAIEQISNSKNNEFLRKDISNIYAEFYKLSAENPIEALAILYRYKEVLLNSGDSSEVKDLIKECLKLQNSRFVEILLEDFDRNSDYYGAAVIKLELADYYARSLQWENVIKQFKDEEIFQQLSEEQSASARLFWGVALQKLKKHREAIVVYEKIPPTTSSYSLSRLNVATAYLRQGWWTDAKIAIEKSTLMDKKIVSNLEYRMYTVLGFSQLEFGFYRDARNNFRKVALDSPFTNKALLGLGLSAMHQKDYQGALNAFGRLRNMPIIDMTVAEAHLLYAFTLQQILQVDAAILAYQDAINFYQKSLDNSHQLSDLNSTKFVRKENNDDLQLRNLKNKKNLVEKLIIMNLPTNTLDNLRNLNTLINVAYSNRYKELIDTEVNQLNSYLSQSKFGLASLYDNYK